MPLRLVARPPTSGRSPSPVLLTRHGYGMDAETMLALSSRFVPDDFLLVSV